MSTFPNSPKLLKGGIVLVDPETAAVRRIISLQYYPDTVTRSLQIQGVSAEGGDRSEILRLKGPPVETIKLDAEIDATDQLEFPDQNANAVEVGIHPQLAALEAIVYPTSEQLQSNNALAKSGTLEIIPMQSALTLFIWSKNRIMPVRLTDFQHHRGGVRSGAQSDPRQGQPGHARAERERRRLRRQGRQSLHDLSAAKGTARRARARGSFANLGIKGIS